MSLLPFRRPRIVVMGARRSVHDAARAMESNHVGMAIVQDSGAVVGVVTDRDIAIRVVGYGLDPLQTILGEIMSTDVATLPISATTDEALQLMRSRGIRRIPLLENACVVGIVAVDDLIVEGQIPMNEVGRIIGVQLAQSCALKPRGRVLHVEVEHSHERSIRTDQALARLVHRVQTMAGIENREVALTALEVVLGAIVRRITPREASDLLTQVPSALRARLLDVTAGSGRDVNRASIERDLARRLDLSNERAARLVVDVGAALEQAAFAGEIDEVVAHLPQDLRGIFPRSAAGAP